MNASTARAYLFPCLLLLAGLALTGCNTIGQQRRLQQTRAQEDKLYLQESLQRLSGRVESLEMEIERLVREREAAGDRDRSQRDREMEQLRQRIAALEQEISAVDRRRRADREKIIASLSERIAGLMRSSGAQTARAGSSGYGYEHVVQQGETLSEIAQAYGVTVPAIVKANSIKNPNSVRAGEKLFIPE